MKTKKELQREVLKLRAEAERLEQAFKSSGLSRDKKQYEQVKKHCSMMMRELSR